VFLIISLYIARLLAEINIHGRPKPPKFNCSTHFQQSRSDESQIHQIPQTRIPGLKKTGSSTVINNAAQLQSPILFWTLKTLRYDFDLWRSMCSVSYTNSAVSLHAVSWWLWLSLSSSVSTPESRLMIPVSSRDSFLHRELHVAKVLPVESSRSWM